MLLSATVVAAFGFSLFGYTALWTIGDALAVLNDRSTRPITVITRKALQLDEQVVRTVTAAIPSASDANRLAVLLESVATEQGVTLTARTVSTVSAATPATASAQAQQQTIPLPPGASAVQFSLSATGSYERLTAFVERLTSVPRFLELRDVFIQVQQTAGTGGVTITSGQLTAQVSGVAFSLPSVVATQE
jgi:hypothetical protein